MMDGDNMGSLLTGEGRESLISYFPEEIIQEVRERTPDIIPILKDNKPLLDPAYQHFFNNALGYYSLNCVPKICKKYNGNLIYSGGDDILALFHPEYAVNAAFELNSVFGKEILDDQFIYGLGRKATLSGTILTVHTKYPLNLALKKAREFENSAKSDYGRNCIVLGFIKHSGELLEGPLFYDAIEYLENMFEIMSTNKISKTLFQELAKNEVIFRDLDLFYDEFSRILKRKISEKENKKQIIEEMQTNLKKLMNIYQMRLNKLDLSYSYIETGLNAFNVFYASRQLKSWRDS
jgi:CRISPR-associated protein Cmr2